MKKSQRLAYERELQKAVHAHNEKIRYHEAKGAKHLPTRQSFAELKSILETKKEFASTISDLRSFGQKGAEKPVFIRKGGTTNPDLYGKTGFLGVYPTEKEIKPFVISKWEKEMVEKQVKQRNVIAAREKAKADALEVTNLNKPMGYKRGEQSTIKGSEFRPKILNWESFRSRSELDMYKKSLKAQTTVNYWKKRNETVQMNYIQGLFNTYGPRAYGLMNKIGAMSNKEFMKKYNAEQNATLEFIYDEFDADVKFDAITLIWTGEEPGEFDIEEFLDI